MLCGLSLTGVAGPWSVSGSGVSTTSEPPSVLTIRRRVITIAPTMLIVKIKLASTADTGFFYVTKKNPRTKTEKLSFRKYDPVVRKHVEFKETKIK